MTDKHPITPPPELVEELQDLGNLDAIRLAYQAGADQELEACCVWLDRNNQWAKVDIDELRDVRRFKPPSLKEQALDELTSAERLYPADWSTIRKALKALPND